MLGIANSGERGNVSLWFARRCNLLASRRSSFSPSSSVFRAALSAFLVAFAVAFFVRSAALAARHFSASFCARLASKARRCCEAALLDGLRVRPLAVGGRKGSGAASSSEEEDTPGDEELLLALVSSSEDNAASKVESSAGWVRDPLVGCDSRHGRDEPTISGRCWEPADGLRDALAWILASMAMSMPIFLSLSKSPLAGRGGSVGAAGTACTFGSLVERRAHCSSGRFKAVAEASQATAEASEAILLLWKAIATCYRPLTLFKDYRLSICVANCQRSVCVPSDLRKSIFV